MTLTLNHQTKFMINVIVEDDTGTLAFCLSFVTSLFALCFRIIQCVSSIGYEFVMVTTDVSQALSFTTKVFTIAFVSLGFGLGVTI